MKRDIRRFQENYLLVEDIILKGKTDMYYYKMIRNRELMRGNVKLLIYLNFRIDKKAELSCRVRVVEERGSQ